MKIVTGVQQFSLFDIEPLVPADMAGIGEPAGKFSNFIVYVDESGDHGMETVDPDYPVFVLAFCVFYKRHYAERVVPALQKFKFNHFGHDLVLLHERDIRKELGQFRFQDKQQKHRFMDGLTSIVDASNFILICCLIDKAPLLRMGGVMPPNPYHLALGFCLETLYELMQEKKQDGKRTHVVVECRGKKEDNELELEFRRICDGANRMGRQLPFDIVFADKKANSAGLQLADLVARPIGLHVLRPEQENRAFRVLEKKFFCRGGRANVGRDYEGWGSRCIRPQKAKGPDEAHRGQAPTGNPQSIGAEYRERFRAGATGIRVALQLRKRAGLRPSSSEARIGSFAFAAQTDP